MELQVQEAGNAVACANAAHRRRFRTAAFGGIATAVAEGAARGTVHNAGHLAQHLYALTILVHLGVSDGNGREQRTGIGVQRVAVQLLAGGNLHNFAEVHDDDTVADMLDHRQVMGNEQVGNAQLRLQVLQQVDDLRLNRNVQCRDRLVAEDDVRT